MTHVESTEEAFDDFIKDKPDLKKVLDVGCRDEYTRTHLQQLGLEWTGIDWEPKSVSVIMMDMHDMVARDITNSRNKYIMPDNSFDIVFICHAFEHSHNPLQLLRECKRVLRPGGWIFISSPCVCDDHIQNGDWDHIFVLESRQMAKLIEFAGFNNIKSFNQISHYKSRIDWFNVITQGQK